jgi:uncharacterized protein YndB with AHSA1/START domain
MIDVGDQVGRTHRRAERGSVVLRRTYDTTIEDLWEACTDAERIGRWFLPVSGDLQVGGSYQLEGNAGGTILKCEPPRMFRVTWAFGDLAPTEVEVRLSQADDGATFELEHVGDVDPEMWRKFGPGAVGVGWDLALLGLGLYLDTGATMQNPEEWQRSPEAIDFITRSSAAWGEAHRAGGATEEDAADAVRNTTAFYTGAPQE